MRKAMLGLLLVSACSEHLPPPQDVVVDAPPQVVFPMGQPCDSPQGSATITAAHQDLQPAYDRLYVAGEASDSGFAFHAVFAKDLLRTDQEVIACMTGDATCPGVAAIVDVGFATGGELGDHVATVRSGASTWQATGTLTLTEFTQPGPGVGHLEGSVHIDSADPLVTLDGTFDHVFCSGLLTALLGP